MKRFLNRSWLGMVVIIVFCECSNRVFVSPTRSREIDPAPVDTFDTWFQYDVSDLPEVKDISPYLSSFIDTLNLADFITDRENRAFIHEDLKEFYRMNDYELFWFNGKRPSYKIKYLWQALLHAGDHGLDPHDYDLYKLIHYLSEVFRDKQHIEPARVVELDIRLTVAYITFGWHLHNGSIRSFNTTDTGDRRKNLSVSKTLVSSRPDKALERLEPPHDHYRELVEALKFYKAIARDTSISWGTLPANIVLALGDSGHYVAELREKLTIVQDLRPGPQPDLRPDNEESSEVFDAELESALKRFQHRHGLTADGIAGRRTLEELNVPLTYRIRQLKANLERIRWMPHELGNMYVYVNIPQFHLYAFKNGHTDLDMRVIIGQKLNATPIIYDSISYIVFNPTWTVPVSIVKNEILPEMMEDSTYLERNRFLIYDGWSDTSSLLVPDSIDWSVTDASSIRVVQAPGPVNALGRVKFIFPNSHNVYLHDTPTAHLFEESNRAFSHGCIRVEYPDRLAEWLLKDQQWDLKRVNKCMGKEVPNTVLLKEKIPVYLVYRTAFIDELGLLNFRKDLYGIDRVQSYDMDMKGEGMAL